MSVAIIQEYLKIHNVKTVADKLPLSQQNKRKKGRENSLNLKLQHH